MAIDISAWLKDLGFTEDESKALLPQFQTRADKLEHNQRMQSDYSKSMNDLKKAQDTLATQEARLNADMAEWAQMTEAEKAASGDLKAKLDAAEGTVFVLNQKVLRLAEDAGVDPKTILGDEKVEPPKKVEPTVDLTPLQQQLGWVSNYFLTLNAELPAIAQEHFELTGERLNTREFIAGIKADLATGKAKPEDVDPVARWEKTYGIAAKRAAKVQQSHDSEIKAAEERGRMAERSEAALPNTHPRVGTHSPLFKALPTTGSVLKRPQPSQRLQGAITALATGKYRNAGKEPAA